jgi:hypothetical protein
MTPEECAAAAAPEVDRLVIGILLRSQPDTRRLASSRGLERIGSLLELRSALLSGSVARRTLDAVARYMPPGALDEELTVQVAQETLTVDPGTGATSLTADGRSAVDALYDLHARVTAEAWTGRDDTVRRLCGVAGRLLDAARPTGGPAFAGLGRPFERAGDPPSLLLFNRLAAMRYHRADAHASAWAAAGHDATSIDELPPGPERDAIEEDTNRRAAPPYAALTATERDDLVAGLSGLASQ